VQEHDVEDADGAVALEAVELLGDPPTEVRPGSEPHRQQLHRPVVSCTSFSSSARSCRTLSAAPAPAQSPAHEEDAVDPESAD
jgi:hypothetical protein